MIDLVLNRRARHLSGNGPIARALLDAARDVGASVHETSALGELEAVVRKIAARGTARVIFAGGDGSYMAGVTALTGVFPVDALPTIAFAPGGTVSTVARDWHRSRTWGAREANAIVRAAAAHALDAADCVTRPTLRVSDDRGGDRVGFIFGAGLVAGFFAEYYAAPTQGTGAAAKIVARVFAQSFVGGELAKRVLDPVAATLTVDGVEADPKAWSLVLASVVRDVGLHMWITPHAGEALDAFHAVASPLGPRALGPQMPLVLAGRKLMGHGHVDAPRAKELVVRFTDPSRAVYVLDGDVMQANQVRVEAGPAIRLAR